MIKIKLDKERNLKLGIRAIRLIEQRYEKPINEVMSGKMLFSDAVYMVYAMLTSDDKEITLEQTIDLLDEYSSVEEIGDIITAVASEKNLNRALVKNI